MMRIFIRTHITSAEVRHLIGTCLTSIKALLHFLWGCFVLLIISAPIYEYLLQPAIAARFDPTVTWYAIKYGITDKSHLLEMPKPHDCDWGKAPIGNKECHFEVRAYYGSDKHLFVGWEKVSD